MKFSRFLQYIIYLSLFASCSLNYGRDIDAEQAIPEFSFKKATLRRVENGKEKVYISADQLEQYKEGETSFGKNVEFKTYDEKGELDLEGFCGLLSANTKSKKYELYNNIHLKSMTQDMEVDAVALRVDEQTEQLTSDRDSEVTIKRDDMEIRGKGFSASGVSNAFSFMYEVEGTLNTEEKESKEQP